MRMRIGRPKAATMIAFAALVASIGGTAYAEKADKQITSKNIADGTIKGKDVKEDAFSGKHIKEGTLDQVPSAASADTAADADTVGGQAPAALDTRWALIDKNGEIEAQTGGFTLVDCYETNGNCYVDAGDDVTDNGLSADIAVNNVDASPTFSGQIGVGACGLDSINCAPPGTELTSVLVVTPRDEAGAVPGGVTPPAAADASRFYVQVTGSAAEVVPAP